MATATISNKVERADGTPQSISVKIQLLWDSTESPVAKDSANDAMIQGSTTIDSDENGSWSLTVTSNDDILPANNVYKIVETAKTGSTSNTYYVSVPNTDPSFWVGDIIVSKPSWVV